MSAPWTEDREKAAETRYAEGFWLIYFEDTEVPSESFSGPGAGDAARARFQACSVNWNCVLVGETATDLPDAIAEIRRLREKVEFDGHVTDAIVRQYRDAKADVYALRELVDTLRAEPAKGGAR